MEKIKGILFDLDGTLLDTLRDLNEACNYALRKYGYPEVMLEETKKFIGNGIRNLIEQSVKGNFTYVEEIFISFKEYYKTHCNVYTKPYNGIKELLEYCIEKEYSLGIVSNKAQFALDILCEEHFPKIFSIIIGDREDMERKPSPQGINLACKAMNLMVEEIIYIGDSPVDIQTCKNSQCKGIFVDYGFSSKEALLSSGAEIICHTPIEIMEMLGE